MIEALICDYNGTISAYKDCGKLWKSVGVAELKTLNPIRFGLLFGAMLKLNSLSKAYKRGEVGYDKIYEAFNDRVLSRTPYHRAVRHIYRFACNKVFGEGKFDLELLKSVRHASRKGVKAGILSAGSEEEIRKLFELTGSNQDFNSIKANRLVTLNEDSCKFDLEIYNNKGEKLDEQLREMKVTGPVAYVGDSVEDYPCFSHDSVKRKFVAPNADEPIKEEASKRFGAIVLTNGRELEKALF